VNRRNLRRRKRSLTSLSAKASYEDPTVPGPLPCTWSRNRMAAGGPAAIPPAQPHRHPGRISSTQYD
jgi:hypothetical protein